MFIEQLLDYRERQQIRKDRLQKRNLRYLTIFFAVLLVLLLGAYAVDGLSPKEAKPVAAKTVQQQELQKIDEFVSIMTKPVESVTQEDIDFIDTLEGDPCYEKNAEVEQGLMAEEIAKCKGLK